jgi:hypothetical protein
MTERLLSFDQPPAFLLDTAFSGVNEKELTALLQFGITRGVLLAFIIIGGERVPWFIGVNPFS